MSDLTLTADQQAAYDHFTSFLMSPTHEYWVLEGFAGTGKSTLVQKLLEDIPKILSTKRLLDPSEPRKDWDVVLTATTNKACEALQSILNKEVKTIQSTLGLRVQTDYRTRETTLALHKSADIIQDAILFIDEASYIDTNLLNWIKNRTQDCKIIFIGDPAQLTPVKSAGTPVFNSQFPTSRLNQVVRQADGCQIKELATRFRLTVTGSGFFQFRPDGVSVQHMDPEQFSAAILAEFGRDDWKHNDSKVLGWTNKCVIGYNNSIRSVLKGEPELQPGDYAVCNSHVQIGRTVIKTDQQVRVTKKRPTTVFDIDGWNYLLDDKHWVFAPHCWTLVKERLKQLKRNEEFSKINAIEQEWIDLRAAYACTINKSQGSTYDRVFIDLDDLKKCNSGNQIARMMYVAVSRARHNVYLKGDLV